MTQARHRNCHHGAYRLTCAQYDELRALADGKCQVCGIPESKTPTRTLWIDHDHCRGMGFDHVRGLVCPECNSALRYVDNGFREPTPEQERYLANSWFLTHHPSPAPAGSLVTTPLIPRKQLPAGPLKKITIQVPEGQFDRFTIAANLGGRGRGQLVNDFIAWYLREPGVVMPKRPDRSDVDRATQAHRPRRKSA